LTSVVLGLHASSRYDDAAAAYDQDGVESAQREADIATVFVVTGFVAAGIGGWLYFKERRDGGSVVVAPTATASTVHVSVVGRF
jgi:hypothetical protein